jgi:dephospho-CoA kinase
LDYSGIRVFYIGKYMIMIPNHQILAEPESMKEIIFVVEEAPEGGFTARALGESVFTEAENIEQLHGQTREAVKSHFGDD